MKNIVSKNRKQNRLILRKGRLSLIEENKKPERNKRKTKEWGQQSTSWKKSKERRKWKIKQLKTLENSKNKRKLQLYVGTNWKCVRKCEWCSERPRIKQQRRNHWIKDVLKNWKSKWLRNRLSNQFNSRGRCLLKENSSRSKKEGSLKPSERKRNKTLRSRVKSKQNRWRKFLKTLRKSSKWKKTKCLKQWNKQQRGKNSLLLKPKSKSSGKRSWAKISKNTKPKF